MKRALVISALVGVMTLTTACSGPANEAGEAAAPETAATETAAPAAPEAPAPTEAPTEAAVTPVSLEIAGHPTGDPVAGKKVFAQCMACHVVQAGVNRVGPSLHGVIGRKAGAVEGFRYSDANKNSGITWTEQELFTYLENPRAVVPGTIMAFAGLRKPEDRANVIAYIKQESTK
ncbi:MAG: cytochrome c family protein [Hyphomonadaceae bacterium]|nr:cytochrome c family protein [Hyphomonadaceae bacterium]